MRQRRLHGKAKDSITSQNSTTSSKDAATIPVTEKIVTSLSSSPVASHDHSHNLWQDGLGKTATRAAQALLILITLAVIVYGMVTLSIVIIPVLIALIIASALQPVVKFLGRHGVRRGFASIIALFTGALVFGGIATLVVNGVRHEWGLLTKEVKNGIDEVSQFITSGSLPISSAQLKEITDAASGFLTSAQFGNGALAGISGAFTFFAGLVLTIVILFFFVKDGPFIWQFILKFFKPTLRSKVERVGESSVTVLGGYINGTTIVATVDAVVIGVALSILHVPLALPLSLIVFVGAFIPIIGATLAGIIAALVALVTNDFHTAIIVGLVVLGVNQLEGNLLAPVVLGNALKLHALVVLLALSIGTILGGIVGTLLAVPIAAVLWSALKAWREPDENIILKE